MITIQKMDDHHRYDVLDLWLRCTAAQNPFLEPNFWENNYNDISSKYLQNCENYLYMDGGRILAFICVSDNFYVKGLFVDPDYRGKGIGRKLIRHIKENYTELHLNIYAKSRRIFNLASGEGFMINGAKYQEESGQVKYTMAWHKKEEN